MSASESTQTIETVAAQLSPSDRRLVERAAGVLLWAIEGRQS
ncbi:MAG TPA: hypothetical protein VM221_10185 [Armatimonadota bacterium]|nr:hypothetical protein [Armatimonadota bacterium]